MMRGRRRSRYVRCSTVAQRGDGQDQSASGAYADDDRQGSMDQRCAEEAAPPIIEPRPPMTEQQQERRAMSGQTARRAPEAEGRPPGAPETP